MKTLEDIGTRLKMARIAAGFKTAKAFCQKHNIPASTYSLHETNQRDFRLNLARKYADLLNIDLVWLLTGNKTIYGQQKENEKTEENLKNAIQSFSVTASPNLHLHPSLFCKIVIEISKIYEELKMSVPLEEITRGSLEIYEDITKSAENPDMQLAMVNLTAKMFKKQILTKK